MKGNNLKFNIMTTCDAVNKLTEEMKKDPSYRIGWQANIAMAFYDRAYQYKKENNKKVLSQNDIHIVANEAADNFLNLLGAFIAG